MRLAEHILDGELISGTGVDALVAFIHSAQQVAEDFGVTETLAFATSAIREASNGDDVLREIRERTGIDLEVLSGDDEARLTFLAVRRWYGWSSGRSSLQMVGLETICASWAAVNSSQAISLDSQPPSVFELQ